MPEVDSLKRTNSLIYALALIGSIIVTFLGITRGECIDYCDASYAEYIPSPSLIAFGLSGILFSTLAFQVINVFALHVKKSHES